MVGRVLDDFTSSCPSVTSAFARRRRRLSWPLVLGGRSVGHDGGAAIVGLWSHDEQEPLHGQQLLRGHHRLFRCDLTHRLALAPLICLRRAFYDLSPS